MNDECLICGAPLVYLPKDEEMECAVCHKTFLSAARCEKGHYVCDSCHKRGLDAMRGVCLSETSRDPVKILNRLMRMPFCHMHGPEHHVLTGAALVTAYRNAGGNVDLEDALYKIETRGSAVPGGSCGFCGACGAAVSSGIFISVISGATPLSEEPFALSNRMTALALSRIADAGGPRCCKRDAYLTISAAVPFVKEHFNVEMELSPIRCGFFPKNNQCIRERCPFFPEKQA